MSSAPVARRSVARLGAVALGILGSAIAAAALLALQPADIRPADFVGHELDEARVARGLEIVRRGVEAQGGREAWNRLETLELSIHDTWDITPFRMYMPLAEDDITLAGRARLHTRGEQSTWTVTSGSAKGERFGVVDGRPWYGSPAQPAGSSTRFYAMTMEYLATIAFRIEEAEVVTWVDSAVRDGELHDRVFVTWGDPGAPTRSLDQYILYYRRSDGLLTAMECTVRDFAPFVTGGVDYTAWQRVDGVLLPFRYEMPLVDLDGPRVHTVVVDHATAETATDHAVSLR